MKLRILSVIVSIVLMMFLLIGCQLNETTKDTENQTKNEEKIDDEESTNEDSEEDKESGPSDEEAEALALDFSLSDGKGNQVNLANFKDKFVFLNFFTTWCGYCMEEMPEFQKVYDEYGKDVAIIIVNVNFDANEITPEEVVAWYEEAGYTFPMVIDEDGTETEAFYPYVSGYPTTFVYDKGGKYLGYISGALDEASMVNIINDYMKQ